MTDTIRVYQIKLSMEDREKETPALGVYRDLLMGSKNWKPEYMKYYTHVADVEVPAYSPEAILGGHPYTEFMEETDKNLEIAYDAMQRIDDSRTPENNPSVTDLTGLHNYHSMSVGDVVHYGGDCWHIVDTFGFAQIKVEPPVVYSKENMNSLKLLINSRISTIKELLEEQPNLQIKNQLTFLTQELESWDNESIVTI